MKITRYSPGGYGAMTEDSEGDYVRLSEIEPLIRRAVDNAKDSGILAGSIIADENAEELRRAQELLRWRKFPDETPEEESDNIAVCYGHIDYRFYRTGSDWRGITHWRPIGPMPEGGE